MVGDEVETDIGVFLYRIRYGQDMAGSCWVTRRRLGRWEGENRRDKLLGGGGLGSTLSCPSSRRVHEPGRSVLQIHPTLDLPYHRPV